MAETTREAVAALRQRNVEAQARALVKHFTKLEWDQAHPKAREQWIAAVAATIDAGA